jgi:hypothetical protein
MMVYGKKKGAGSVAFKMILDPRKFTALEMNVYLAISSFDNAIKSMSGGASGAA